MQVLCRPDCSATVIEYSLREPEISQSQRTTRDYDGHTMLTALEAGNQEEIKRSCSKTQHLECLILQGKTSKSFLNPGGWYKK